MSENGKHAASSLILSTEPIHPRPGAVLAIIQARMGSTRLPGKSMALLAGIPLIEHVVKRAHGSQIVNHVCVALPDTPENDVLASHVASLHNTDVVRGPEQDVLARFAGALMQYPNATAIVRITADDPFKDHELIDYALTGFLVEWADPSGELAPPHYLWLGGITWPMGLDVEVISRHALLAAHEHATDPYEREHVVPWIAKTYGVWNLKNQNGHGSINDHWTIDTAADLTWARCVYDHLWPTNPLFGFRTLIDAGYCGQYAGEVTV